MEPRGIDARQIRGYSEREIRVGLESASIAHDIVRKLFLELAKFPGVATRNDHSLALAYAIRDRLLHSWVRSARVYLFGRRRTVIYLSAEYLIGPQLGAQLLNLHIEDCNARRSRGAWTVARRVARARGRAGARQRRPGAPRGVLHGIAGNCLHSRSRPWPSLRVRDLRPGDPFLVLADFRAYADAQARVASAWQDGERRLRSSITCVARAGYFSCDRSIREYSERIWRVAPVDVAALTEPPAPSRTKGTGGPR